MIGQKKEINFLAVLKETSCATLKPKLHNPQRLLKT